MSLKHESDKMIVYDKVHGCSMEVWDSGILRGVLRADSYLCSTFTRGSPSVTISLVRARVLCPVAVYWSTFVRRRGSGIWRLSPRSELR